MNEPPRRSDAQGVDPLQDADQPETPEAPEGIEASEAEPEQSLGVFGWTIGILLTPFYLLWHLGILQIILFGLVFYFVIFEWELISFETLLETMYSLYSLLGLA